MLTIGFNLRHTVAPVQDDGVYFALEIYSCKVKSELFLSNDYIYMVKIRIIAKERKCEEIFPEFFFYYNLPISGTNSDVAGIFSAISNMKTENASKTVMPSVIFSPESGGSQNPSKLRIVNHKHGKMILNR